MDGPAQYGREPGAHIPETDRRGILAYELREIRGTVRTPEGGFLVTDLSPV